MQFFLTILLLSLRIFSLAQSCCIETCNEVNPKIDVEEGRLYQNRRLLTSIKKNEVLISFKEAFSDSITTCIDGLFFRSDFVKSDSIELGLSNVAFKVTFPRKQKNMKICFEIKPEKSCICLQLNRKYRMIKVFRIENRWSIIKTNYVPVYY